MHRRMHRAFFVRRRVCLGFVLGESVWYSDRTLHAREAREGDPDASGEPGASSCERSSIDAQDFSFSRMARVGYLIGCDRYFKRDDVGIIYAINVVPDYRRSFVAAALLKAQFDRSAYGCKLYCC